MRLNILLIHSSSHLSFFSHLIITFEQQLHHQLPLNHGRYHFLLYSKLTFNFIWTNHDFEHDDNDDDGNGNGNGNGDGDK